MGILCINNRTENWKTTRYFAPYFTSESARSALIKRLCPSDNTPGKSVQIELFWKGTRDYLVKKDIDNDKKISASKVAHLYNCIFPDLRKKILNTNGVHLKLPNGYNYCVCTDKDADRLYINLRNTEIDVVLESPRYLYIGEAKYKSDFGTNGDLVLVHQLIRQYVAARILTRHLASHGAPGKEVIPFVIGRDATRLKKKHQIIFMSKRCWLDKNNILTWDCIENMAKAEAGKEA